MCISLKQKRKTIYTAQPGLRGRLATRLAMDVVLEEVHRGEHVVHQALMHPRRPVDVGPTDLVEQGLKRYKIRNSQATGVTGVDGSLVLSCFGDSFWREIWP